MVSQTVLLLLALLLQCSAAIAVHFQAKPDCRDAAPDEHCYRSVTWLLEEGLAKHPNWYPYLSSKSSFQEVQATLFKAGKSNCSDPCPAAAREEDCLDAEQGDECFRALTWVKSGGLQKHPDWYPGLTVDSSLEDIQAELHRRGKAGCLKPCPPAEPGCDKQGLCQRKMPVEAMTLEQLNRFLSGQWDGYTMASKEQEKAWETLRARAVASTSTAPAASATSQAVEAAEGPAGNVAKLAPHESQASLAKLQEEASVSGEPLPEIDQQAEEVKDQEASLTEAQPLPEVEQAQEVNAQEVAGAQGEAQAAEDAKVYEKLAVSPQHELLAEDPQAAPGQ